MMNIGFLFLLSCKIVIVTLVILQYFHFIEKNFILKIVCRIWIKVEIMVNTHNLVLSEKAFNNQKRVSWIESIRMYFLSTDLYASLRQTNLHGEFLSEKKDVVISRTKDQGPSRPQHLRALMDYILSRKSPVPGCHY